LKISIIDPTTDCRWDQFVDSHEKGTIFHTSAWARVLKETYGCILQYYILENEAGQLKAAIPLCSVRSWLTGRRLVCLPFSDYCSPLSDNEADITLLLNSVKEDMMTGAAGYLEIRGWHNGINPSELELVIRNYHLDYFLDLEPDVNTLENRFHHSIRRCIKQGQKRGVSVRITSTEADLDYFYKLNVTTRKKLGVLPQPRAFFKALYRHVISQNLGFIVVAESEGKIIAGVLFLTYKNTIYYKFNASDERHLQKRPNHLIIWEAIRYACANGYKLFDFGRCSPEEEGLRTYKRHWGAREVSLPYYYYPEVKGLATITENSLRYRIMKILSHMVPTFVFRITGSLLYKHMA
jgi:lipid II:glycine glycyltransferase (peptidoglycan interpeptide bridge formation enzyme)